MCLKNVSSLLVFADKFIFAKMNLLRWKKLEKL
jgi:hypothetical protein